ncbi:MAG: hypothetical protein AAGB48_06305 [Planctomycetota bacterium]
MPLRTTIETTTTITIAATILGIAGAAASQPLVGSGPNLPIPSPNDPPPPQQPRAVTTGSGTWTGTWTSPAAANWVGSFNAIGPVPAGVTSTGTTRYDFSSLPTGQLPADTFFRFGDVDGGSTTTEVFTLIAFDTGGSLITTPWLDEPLAVTGSGTGGGGTILPGNTPGWSWTAGTGTYVIDGSTVTGGNPSISIFMESNTSIASMQLTRGSTFASFSLAAPLIPAPSAMGVLAGAGLLVSRRRR